jgi:phosphoglycolate phosphatase-like HAD superfamily hydrolase
MSARKSSLATSPDRHPGRRGPTRLFVLLAGCVLWALAAGAAADPLPSWNDGPAKRAILAFVAGVTAAGTPTFVPPAERIAVFDNDGTLWCEQPVYFQFLFAFDRVRALAPAHPEWKDHPAALAAAIKGDMTAFAASGEQGLMQVLAVTHGGMTTDEFARSVAEWLATARHPRFKRPYTDLVYQPMLELLGHLRASGFKTFIVSGGGVEFMRVFAERVYGIPPEQVVGSSVGLAFEYGPGGTPVLRRLASLDFVDDKAGKPIGIQRFIGRRPILAFGNSDGDREMLEWTAAGGRPHLAALVRHTDAAREYAYDRRSRVGRLDKAWDEAVARGWTVVDMKQDWRRVFSFE